MRTLLKSRKNRLIVAVLAVGSLTLPAASSAQSSTAHKKSHNASAKSSSGPTKASTGKKSSKSSKSSSAKSKGSKRVKGQTAPTPERINEIQSVLAQKGIYTASPSGKWDDSTVDAMRKFQASNNLRPTGKLDALTLQKLGLGSETAGLGSPTPPPNATPNRLLSSRAQTEELKNEPE